MKIKIVCLNPDCMVQQNYGGSVEMEDMGNFVPCHQCVVSDASKKKKLLLLNSPIVTGFGKYTWEECPTQNAIDLVHREDVELVSAIGHEATASLMSIILGVPVEVRRVKILMPYDGTSALVFRLLDRLPEGEVLDTEKLSILNYRFGLLHYNI